MIVTFFGAVREVTGSMHMLSVNSDNILLDCGMFQGRRKESVEKNKTFSVDPKIITNIMAGKKIPLYGDGKNERDWLYVIDNCRAIWHAFQHGRPGEIYNIGGGTELTNINLTIFCVVVKIIL